MSGELIKCYDQSGQLPLLEHETDMCAIGTRVMACGWRTPEQKTTTEYEVMHRGHRCWIAWRIDTQEGE